MAKPVLQDSYDPIDEQTLAAAEARMGVTGSGKTITAANAIQAVQRPTFSGDYSLFGPHL